MAAQKISPPAIWTRNFIVISLVNLFVFFSFQMIFPVLPVYVKKLGGTDTLVGVVMGISTVSPVIVRPVTGLLLDNYGKKPVLMFFLSFTYGSIIGFLPLYAASEGVPGIGAFFTVFALTILVTRPLIGRLIDRSGLTVVLLPGFFCLLAGIFSLAEGTTLQEFLIIAFVYGLRFGSLQTTLQTMAVRDIPQCRLGAANATLYTGFDLGMGIGVIILGIIAQNWGYRVMYLFTMVPVVLSILYYVFWAKKHLHVPPGICPRAQDDTF